jgi:hypothetical protein
MNTSPSFRNTSNNPPGPIFYLGKTIGSVSVDDKKSTWQIHIEQPYCSIGVKLTPLYGKGFVFIGYEYSLQ